MKVVRSEHAGACYGVKRALRLAHEAAKAPGRAQTLGALIHNPKVVDALASEGVEVARTPADVCADTVVVRSHGVTPEVMRQVRERAANVVDATCPHVMRAQRAAQRLAREGRLVVVVGEEDHPEVRGLVAWAHEAGGRVVVADGADALPARLEGPVGVVVQTTQTRERLDEVVAELRRRSLDPKVADTVCAATSERQDAARRLAGQVDAMVVIGGRNSANTSRLFEICQEAAPRAYHVEDASELSPDQFAGCEVVGVTAGASTPEDQIADVVERIESFDPPAHGTGEEGADARV